MREKTKIVAFMVWKIICLVITAFLWVTGLLLFNNLRDGSGIGNIVLSWCVWGFACFFIMPIELIKHLFSSAKDGEIQGASEFK